MKSLLAILTVITLVISTSGVSFAAFTSDGKSTFSASSGTVGGTASVTVPFSAQLKNISGDSPATSLTWGTVTAGTTSWLATNQYIAVRGFATYSDWGIQIYTDNKAAAASPQYTGTGDPAGLVRSDNTLYSIPMCWRAKANEKATAHEREIYAGSASGNSVLYDGVTPHDIDNTNPDDTTRIHAPGASAPYYPWFYMLDKGTPDVDLTTAGNQLFGNYRPEATFIGSAGYHHAPGTINYATPIGTDITYYVYMGAGFTMAVPQKTYQTSTVTVEMYHL